MGLIAVVCFAGGLYLGEPYFPRCLENGYECNAAAIIDTQFEENRATFAGGAIFTEHMEIIRFQCNSSSKNGNLTFTEKTDWSFLHPITSEELLCPAWRNNSASFAGYGHIVGSYATMAKMTVEYKGEKTEVLTGGGFEVQDYVGGNQLPTLSVELIDALKQGPATIDSFNERISATLSTSEGFRVGDVSMLVAQRVAKFPLLIGFGLPGVYNITITFSDQDSTLDGAFYFNEFIDPFIITVHVRNCTIGEMPVGETKICSNCSTSTYNFDPEEEECQPCPENGNCTTRVIIPKAGYWHASPCSVNITRCLTSYACKFDNRVEILTNLTRDMKNCSINATTIEEYQKEQCAEASDWSRQIRSSESLCSGIQGHTGPLCGACDASYGSSVSSECEECPTAFGNIVIVSVSALILLGLAGITIRGTLNTFSSRRAMLSGHRRIPRSIQLRDLSLPSEEEVSEIQASQEDSAMLQDTDGLQKSVSVAEVTLGQWKAVEMFKV